VRKGIGRCYRELIVALIVGSNRRLAFLQNAVAVFARYRAIFIWRIANWTGEHCKPKSPARDNNVVAPHILHLRGQILALEPGWYEFTRLPAVPQ
jgi:hypothetical protein